MINQLACVKEKIFSFLRARIIAKFGAMNIISAMIEITRSTELKPVRLNEYSLDELFDAGPGVIEVDGKMA